MTDLLLASKWFNGAFVFLLGMLVVFFGITIIIFVVAGIGKIMSAKNGKPTVKTEKDEDLEQTETEELQTYDGASPEVVAAITAVLSAYYFSNESNCEFKIKKIKRIY